MSNMFGFTLPIDLSDKERDPPAQPLTPEFPAHTPNRRCISHTRNNSDLLRQRILKFKSPADVTPEDVERLNIHMLPDLPLAELCPPGKERDRPFRHDDALTAALEDISISNDDAFPVILRKPAKDGEKRPRLGAAHNFFVALERMSHFWDDSKDNYYEIPDTSGPTPGIGTPPPPGQATKLADDDEATTSTLKMKLVYKGRRSGNGAQMPVGDLEKCVKELIDMCRRSFDIATYERRFPARLIIRGFKMPIALRYDVGRIPHDRKLARAERLEGPIMGVHARPELKFKSNEDESSSQAEVLDLYREIGACLLVAQKRARAGLTEKLPGKGQWWGDKKRWGGMRGGHMPYESDEEPCTDPSKKQEQPEEDDNSSSSSSEEEQSSRSILRDLTNTGTSPANTVTPRKRPKSESRQSPSKAKTEEKKKEKKTKLSYRQKTMIDKYRKVAPGESLWDDHINYQKVGHVCEYDKRFDDVWVLSAVNHHVSFLHMRVHEDYIRWLETGAEPEQDEEDGVKTTLLYVRRSGWFNLFDVEERKQALEGLWRILNWVFRDQREDKDGDVRRQMEMLKSTGFDMHLRAD